MKNNSIKFALILSLGFISLINAQNKEIRLWDIIPGAIQSADYKQEPRIDDKGNITGIRKVIEPTLKIFLADNKNTKNAAVIICPGGGYGLLSHEKEGDKVAEWLNLYNKFRVLLNLCNTKKYLVGNL